MGRKAIGRRRWGERSGKGGENDHQREECSSGVWFVGAESGLVDGPSSCARAGSADLWTGTYAASRWRMKSLPIEGWFVVVLFVNDVLSIVAS